MTLWKCRMYRVTLLAVACLCLELDGQEVRLNIEALMSASQFKQAGLNKLSQAELDSLSEWLTNYSLTVYKRAASVTAAQPASASVIETQIDDEFEGWDGESIFKLANGQIWQQSSYAYTYHYAYRPKVIIYKTGGLYKMKVDGVDSTIFVKRLK